jgi:hypothetical protein
MSFSRVKEYIGCVLMSIRNVGHDLGSHFFEMREHHVDVFDFETEMVQSFSVVLEKRIHRTSSRRGFQEVNLSITYVGGPNPNRVRFDLPAVVEGNSK